MVFSFNNMNNPWMNLAQQGMGMLFGGNCMNSMNGMMGMNSFMSMNSMMGMNTGFMGTGMSFGGTTGIGCGNSIFTNCFGQPNYDAMAGFGVASAVFSVATSAIQHSRAQKAAEKGEPVTDEDIKKVEKEIDDLKAKKNDTNTIE